MALLSKVGSLTVPASTGEVAITGLGFQPKLVIFLTVGSNALNTSYDHACFSIGAAVSPSQEGSSGWYSEDGVGTSNTYKFLASDRCFQSLLSSSGAVDFSAEFVSMDSDGFTYRVLTAPAATRKVGYLALGGTDLENVYIGVGQTGTSSGTKAFTGVGFQPTSVLLYGCNIGDGISDHAINSIGFSDDPLNNFNICAQAEDNQATTDSDCANVNDQVMVEISKAGAFDGEAELDSFDADGFTLNITNAFPADRRFLFVAMKGPLVSTGQITTKTSTGQFTETGLGFEPNAAIFITALLANYALNGNAFSSFAAADGNGMIQAHAFDDGDVGTASSYKTLRDDSLIVKLAFNTGIIESELDVVSFDSDGFTFDQIDADSGLRHVFYLALGGILSVDINPIVSTEVFGSPTLTTGNVNIAPNGIVTKEVFGSTTVSPGNVNISPNGIGTKEVFGIPSVYPVQYVEINSIVSEESFGIPKVLLTISSMGIPSEEIFGFFITITTSYSIVTNGISSEETFGVPGVSTGSVFIQPDSIVSLEVWGNCRLTFGITMIGIPSAETFGDAAILPGSTPITTPTGIVSGEAFGTPSFSTGGVQLNIIGIVTSELFGSPTLVPGGISVSPNSISSSEVWSNPVVVAGDRVIAMTGIISSEAFGNLSLVPQFVSVHPRGIPSYEIFGGPSISTGNVNVSANSILSSELFGPPSVSPGIVYITPIDISSLEFFGSPSVSPGNVDISINGIPTSEGFGSPTLGINMLLNPVPSSELWGQPSISVGGVLVVLTGITSEESFGSHTVRNLWVLAMESILSGEGFGIPYVTVRVLNAFEQMMEKDLEDGFFEDTEFARHGIYTSRKSGESFDIIIIFDNDYETVDPGTGASVQTSGPMAQCQTSKLRRRPTNGDKLQVNGTNFEVLEHDNDGTGVTTLILHKEKTV